MPPPSLALLNLLLLEPATLCLHLQTQSCRRPGEQLTLFELPACAWSCAQMYTRPPGGATMRGSAEVSRCASKSAAARLPLDVCQRFRELRASHGVLSHWAVRLCRWEGWGALLLCVLLPPTSADGFTASVRRLLDDVHAALLSAAEARLASGTVRSIASYAQFLELAAKSSSVPAAVAAEHSDADGRLLPQSTALAAASSVNGAGSVSPFVLAPWHDDAAAEAQVKSDTSFTIRCFPLGPSEALSVGEAPAPLAVPAGSVCFFSGKPATHMALFARAY